MKQVALYYFNKPNNIESWSLGPTQELAYDINAVNKLLSQEVIEANAEWLLLWDYKLGKPDEKLISQLTDENVDVWHCGLKTGVADLPDALNYIDPTWMYNCNADIKILHSSFRLSLRCCLIKRDVLAKINFSINDFTSLNYAGIGLGYALIKNGAIIRYAPGLIDGYNDNASIDLYNEWVFIRKFSSSKWHLWCLLMMESFGKQLRHYRRTRFVKKYLPNARIHLSKVLDNSLNLSTSVSVLAPTLQRYTYLKTELEQLRQQTLLPHEVLITDQTEASLRQNIDVETYIPLVIKYFAQDEKGQCIAWNKLLSESTGEYVLFLGDDADEIYPLFLEQLVRSAKRFNCDMVATHVVEFDNQHIKVDPYYRLTDTFPISLVKKDLLLKAGFMDMFFNKNIRADQDLAMRCHLQGALMIYDPAAVIFHHRAPVGGLRAHKARVVTNSMAKKSLSKFVSPTSSEIYLAMKYFTEKQVNNFIYIKYLNQLFIKGGILRRIARTAIFIMKLPALRRVLIRNKQLAKAEILKNAMSANEGVASYR